MVRAKLELREECSEQDALDVVEIMKSCMVDTVSDNIGIMDFSRYLNNNLICWFSIIHLLIGWYLTILSSDWLTGRPAAVVQYNTWKGGGIIAVNYEARAKGVTRNMRGDQVILTSDWLTQIIADL